MDNRSSIDNEVSTGINLAYSSQNGCFKNYAVNAVAEYDGL